jgi:hypothetical protein
MTSFYLKGQYLDKIMKCILDCRDIVDVGYAAINNCDMIYCRIHDVNGKIMLYKKDFFMDEIIFVSVNLQIIVEPVSPISDEMIDYLLTNSFKFWVVSKDRQLIKELYIKNCTMTLGLLEEDKYLELTDQDFIVSFVILLFADDIMSRMKNFRDEWRNVNFYCYNVKSENSAGTCKRAELDGVLFTKSLISRLKDYV